MLNAVFPDRDLLPRVLAFARNLARSPPQSLMESKKVILLPNISLISAHSSSFVIESS